jgi:Ferritin-like domain
MPMSRSQVIRGAAFGLIAPSLISAMIAEAKGATSADITLMNGAIELENAGVKAYTDAFTLNLLSPGVLAVAQGFRSDHQAHAAALSAAVRSAGGTPPTTPAPLTYPPLKSETDILTFAETVERGAATTYVTDIGKLSNPALAKLMASILGVETTHVATIAAVLKQGRPYSGFVS